MAARGRSRRVRRLRGQLAQSFVTDVSWKTFTGEGSGEAYSLRFDGTGVVYIQPAER